MHEILADLPGINWGNVQVFWGDERTVGPDSPQSNYGMARDTLLANVEIPDANVHRMRGELDPQEAAQDYAAVLQQAFEVVPPDVPRMDVNVLGIGPDGHTASLFPSTDALKVLDRWVVANWVPQQDTWRITLTYPVLNAAKHTMFLVAGQDKADALYRIFSPNVADKPPAAGVQPQDGSVTFFLDEAAAEGVRRAQEEAS
jgi:6-phosphogluconolactonase